MYSSVEGGPLPADIAETLNGKEVVVVENNATGQFSNLLKQAGVTVSKNVLKYNGMPFTVEELGDRL